MAAAAVGLDRSAIGFEGLAAWLLDERSGGAERSMAAIG